MKMTLLEKFLQCFLKRLPKQLHYSFIAATSLCWGYIKILNSRVIVKLIKSSTNKILSTNSNPLRVPLLFSLIKWCIRKESSIQYNFFCIFYFDLLLNKMKTCKFSLLKNFVLDFFFSLLYFGWFYLNPKPNQTNSKLRS